MSTEIDSMYAIPARYAKRFKMYLSPTPEIRSALVDADTDEVLAVVYWEEEKNEHREIKQVS